ncbi:MAG: DUF922 domain-containing Zn-dependent protease [Gemmatimonadaceae bacterium]|nr:DUF922 domain-containing Zn-dependent protease [Gemmatimonadaceae bacterium]
MTVDSSSSTFVVSGRTSGELSAALRLARSGARMGIAETRSFINWRFRSEMRVARCEVVQAVVSVRLRTLLPQWADSAMAPEALRSQWLTFQAALRVHEQGHSEIALRQAAELASTMQRSSAENCRVLDQMVEALGSRTIARLRAEDSRYDSTTKHGATQGAVWRVALDSTARRP